jgi:RHS repeat-associated protein
VNYSSTGQEDDDELGFYNYGARLYDPVLGKFLSPDSIAQAPDDPQTLNRYSYARNNPIIYIDPEGNFFIIAAIIGALLGGVTSAIQGGDFRDILKGIAIGALSGAVGGFVAGEVAGLLSRVVPDPVAAALGGATGGMAGGATNAALTMGNIGQAMLIGGISGGIGGALGIAIKDLDWVVRGVIQVSAGALIGGTIAELTGGKFYEGAMMGAVSGAVGFGTSELIGVYFPEIKRLEARAIEMLGKTALDLKRASLGRDFNEKVEKQSIEGSDPFNKVKALYEAYKNKFSPNIQLLRSIDAGNQSVRFGSLHVRLLEALGVSRTEFHFDNFDVVTSPIRHGAEWFYQGIVHNNW